jgi:phosphatidylserine/phosphatidylglycerophosphate/cardiolipin synthase-like enzyme
VLNERDHRKIIVLDGRTALVGGHCIVDSWLGDALDGKHVRDISVRLRGPIVVSGYDHPSQLGAFLGPNQTPRRPEQADT